MLVTEPFPKDPQSLFDRVCRHLHKQNAISVVMVGDEYHCRYRGPNGLMCAIGACIPDSVYHPTMDEGCGPVGFQASKVISDFLHQLNLDSLSENELSNLQHLSNDLQVLHDRVEINDWPFKLRAVATLHNLNDEVVNELWGNVNAV